MTLGFHATGSTIEEFNLNYLNDGEHNFGVGIYFSTKKDNLDFYLSEEINPRIYETEIQDEKLVLWHRLIDNSIIEKLVNLSPLREELLAKKDMQYFIDKYSNKNYFYFFKNFTYECWNLGIQQEPVDELYLKKVLEQYVQTGIDGMIMENGTFRTELVIFNPKILRISQTHFYL